MSEELTHYDVLGVEPTAGKDDIKAAYQERLGEVQADISREQGAKKPDADAIDGYRREEARVRTAWQVLSDPYQRGRYDVTVESGGALVAAGALDGDEIDDDGYDEDAVPLSPRDRARQQRLERAERARSGPQRQTMLSTERPPVPPSWPAGAIPPPPRARTLAMLVDILVLMVLLVVVQNLTRPIIEDQYPKEVNRVEQIDKQLDQLDKCIERRPDEGANEPAICQSNDGAALNKSRLEDRRDNLEEERKDVANEYLLPSLAYANLGWAILALLYLVPSSALTGRTLGKRFFWVRAIRADGSPLGWGGAIKRYGAIIVSAAVLSSIPVVSVFAFPIVLFAVLTWPRNPTLQGVQDRFAKTIVVDG